MLDQRKFKRGYYMVLFLILVDQRLQTKEQLFNTKALPTAEGIKFDICTSIGYTVALWAKYMLFNFSS
jgi:hypothetical protein